MQIEDKFLLPTPGGIYYLVQDQTSSWQKTVLKNLLSHKKSPALNTKNLLKLFETDDETQLKEKIDECEKLKLIQIIDTETIAPHDSLEKDLYNILHVFSNKQKVLLSDSQGFCISNHGFPSEISDELSVLSADIAIMHKRRAIGINKKIGFNSQAWSIVDASGNSKLGFWPLNIEDEVFVLAIEGVPFFNRPEFITLVWMLYLRYGEKQA